MTLRELLLILFWKGNYFIKIYDITNDNVLGVYPSKFYVEDDIKDKQVRYISILDNEIDITVG